MDHAARNPTQARRPSHSTILQQGDPGSRRVAGRRRQLGDAGQGLCVDPLLGLNQITPANVAKLSVAFTFSTGDNRTATKRRRLVVDGTMYVITPFPNYLFALDLTKPGAPAKWIFEPKPAAASQGVACCDPVNRGAVYYQGKIFFNTLDGHTVAVDAESGKESGAPSSPTSTRARRSPWRRSSPSGKVLVGNSGGEMGVRGWLTALDEGTGKIAWQAYNTGPDKDVLIGPDFKPFYAPTKARTLGSRRWPPEQWKIGGGTVWGWISYDPELNLIYYGTGNPGPWNPDQRPGDNKWTTGVFARDIATRRGAYGSTRLRRTTCSIMTTSTRSILVDIPG